MELFSLFTKKRTVKDARYGDKEVTKKEWSKKPRAKS